MEAKQEPKQETKLTGRITSPGYDGEIWKELPEIDLIVRFSVQSGSSGYLGCHCATLSNVSLYMNQASGGIRRANGAPIYGAYIPGGFHEPPKEEKIVLDYLEKSKFTFSDDDLKVIYSGILKKASTVPLHIISDAINRGSLARPAGTSAVNYRPWARTIDFVDFLIRNKIGYVMESPAVQNPQHQSKTDYGMNQAFIWIPPEQLAHTLYTSSEYGVENLPDNDSWKEVVLKDLKRIHGKEVATKDTVTDYVFRPGHYKDNRFIRSNDSYGASRVISEVKAEPIPPAPRPLKDLASQFVEGLTWSSAVGANYGKLGKEA